MIQKGAATLAVVAFVALCCPLNGQTNRLTPTPSSPASSTPTLPAPSAPSNPALDTPQTDSSNPLLNPAAPELPTPHITIATPAPAPAPWPWQQRVSWAANLVLVLFAYIFIMMAISLLRKIERQGQLVEDVASAAASSANAALRLAEAKARAERPWVLVTVRPAIGVEDTFSVIATNRGLAPAKIAATIEEIVCAVDEKALSETPEFTKKPTVPQETVILLPEETIELLSFSRDDVIQVSETEERLKRIEDWEEKIYLYGRVMYRDLTAPDDRDVYETSWMCWYIHGRQKSGMVMAGPPAYNLHT